MHGGIRGRLTDWAAVLHLKRNLYFDVPYRTWCLPSIELGIITMWRAPNCCTATRATFNRKYSLGEHAEWRARGDARKRLWAGHRGARIHLTSLRTRQDVHHAADHIVCVGLNDFHANGVSR